MSDAVDPIVAVTERDATGETAEIFHDIKQVTGVGVVNLVWRRLAVTPGALPATWAMLRDAYASGHVATQAEHFRQHLRAPALPVLPPTALRAAGIDRLGHLSILAVLDSYNRTNAINLLGLGAVLARIEPRNASNGHPSGSDDVAREDGHPLMSSRTVNEARLPALPPLPAMAALDPGLRDLVERLNSMCEQDGQIVASMYRHLAYWPGYLALAWALLAPVVADGRMQAAIDEVRIQAAKRARLLAVALPPLDTQINQPVAKDIRSVLTLFTQHPISKMLAICHVLSVATPGFDGPSTG